MDGAPHGSNACAGCAAGGRGRPGRRRSPSVQGGAVITDASSARLLEAMGWKTNFAGLAGSGIVAQLVWSLSIIVSCQDHRVVTRCESESFEKN